MIKYALAISVLAAVGCTANPSQSSSAQALTSTVTSSTFSCDLVAKSAPMSSFNYTVSGTYNHVGDGTSYYSNVIITVAQDDNIIIQNTPMAAANSNMQYDVYNLPSAAFSLTISLPREKLAGFTHDILLQHVISASETLGADSENCTSSN